MPDIANAYTATHREQLRAWITFLAPYQWTHVAHLTSRFPQCEDALIREFGAFIRRLERCAQSKVLWVRALEFAGDRFHVHAILSTTLPTLSVKRRRRCGNTSVRCYNGVSGLRYALKQIMRGGTRVDFCLPRLRGSRCA